MSQHPVTRRNVLRIAGASVGAGLVAPRALADMGGGTGGTGPSGSAVKAFSVPLRVPPVLSPDSSDATTDYYTLTAAKASQEILPGRRTPVWGYGGQFPGPTIMARRGRRTVVKQVNHLDVPITTHLHGGHLPPQDDGYPTDLIAPGASKTYTFPNQQRAATLWYHDHRMDATAKQVWMGLAGLYVLKDDLETSLPLPSGAHDVPLLIQDRSFDADGSFAYPDSMMTTMSGAHGDTILVNGRPQPFFRVAARKYRFRVVNGSNARAYRLALSDGHAFQQIATDGGLLPAPVRRTELLIAPGERYEVVVDFSKHSVGSKVVLRNLLGSGSTASVMRFDVVRREADSSSVPARLRPITRLHEADAAVTRTFDLGMAGGMWVINGRPFDGNRIDARPRLGATEIWEFRAGSMGGMGGMGGGGMAMFHPMHLHLVQFQVLDRNGRPPAPGEAGWKDTVVVNGGETVRVIARFTGFRGKYVFHCHILEHEDHMMMSQFEVV